MDLEGQAEGQASGGAEAGSAMVASTGSSGGSSEADGDTDFLSNRDLGAFDEGCDIYTQDCGPGLKCAIGGSGFDVRRCVPIAAWPGRKGAVCHRVLDPSGAPTGEDSCDLGLMCWDVDPETGYGLCLALCEGDDANPLCSDPNESCAVGKSLSLCFPKCVPLDDTCPIGCACYPVDDAFACFPNGSGDLGGYADPCEFINACDMGNVCLGAAAVPGCAGASGCCTPFCDLGAPDCPGIDQGVECVPWYREHEAPPSYEHLGVCIVPQ